MWQKLKEKKTNASKRNKKQMKIKHNNETERKHSLDNKLLKCTSIMRTFLWECLQQMQGLKHNKDHINIRELTGNEWVSVSLELWIPGTSVAFPILNCVKRTPTWLSGNTAWVDTVHWCGRDKPYCFQRTLTLQLQGQVVRWNCPRQRESAFVCQPLYSTYVVHKGGPKKMVFFIYNCRWKIFIYKIVEVNLLVDESFSSTYCRWKIFIYNL